MSSSVPGGAAVAAALRRSRLLPPPPTALPSPTPHAGHAAAQQIYPNVPVSPECLSDRSLCAICYRRAPCPQASRSGPPCVAAGRPALQPPPCRAVLEHQAEAARGRGDDVPHLAERPHLLLPRHPRWVAIAAVWRCGQHAAALPCTQIAGAPRRPVQATSWRPSARNMCEEPLRCSLYRAWRRGL